jgi:hypothetical protein
MWSRRLCLVAGVFTATVTGALTSPPPAAAQTECGQEVLTAWSDGRLGSNYAIHCYEWALSHLPADVEGYTSASDDIRRALLAAVRIHGDRTTGGSVRRLAGADTSAENRHEDTLPPTPLLIVAGSLVLVAGAATGVRTARRPRGATRRGGSRAQSR